MHSLASTAATQQEVNTPPAAQKGSNALFQQDAPCAGVAAAAVLPVVGVGIAVTQVVRGAVAEPTAISERLRGREWDQVRLCQHTSTGSRADPCMLPDNHCESWLIFKLPPGRRIGSGETGRPWP